MIKFSKEIKEKAKHLRKEFGLSVIEISKQLNIDDSTIFDWVKEIKTDKGIVGYENNLKFLKEKAIKLFKEKKTISEVTKILNLNRSTVKNWFYRDIPFELQQQIIQNLQHSTQEYQILKQKVQELFLTFKFSNKEIAKQLNVSVYTISTWTRNLAKQNEKEMFLNKFLKKDVNYYSRTKLKLIEYGLKENKCEICGQLSNWNKQKLNLQIHHINNNNKDNRIENLQILCPNCHSQTDSYCKKNFLNSE